MENQRPNFNFKKILDNVRASTMLFCTKDGKVYSSEAENFLDWLNGYTKYIIPEEVESFKCIARNRIYAPLVPKLGVEITPEVQRMIDSRDYAIMDDLFGLMNAGEIMETYDKTKSWDEVGKVLEEQGHSGYTFSCVTSAMLQFAKIGVEFVDRFAENRKENEEFLEWYHEQKQRREERTALGQRVVDILAERI